MSKRVILKLSGEQLSGKFESGLDPEVAHYLAKEAKKVADAGIELIIVVGGGNLIRGAKVAGNGIRRVTADQMGMLSGLMNAMAMTDIFESEGVATRCMTGVFATQLAESYSYRLAEKHLERKRVILIAGGMARPYFTHDTAAVSYALELDCGLVLKATKVDGVYDKDPAKYKDAKKLDKIGFAEAVSNVDISVMDKAAMGLAMEHNMPICVFDPMIAGNILRAAQGTNHAGTLIS